VTALHVPVNIGMRFEAYGVRMTVVSYDPKAPDGVGLIARHLDNLSDADPKLVFHKSVAWVHDKMASEARRLAAQTKED
jgi:hypothetical protein